MMFDRNNQDLEIIRNWLKKEPLLPDEYDDMVLYNFLKNCKFSLEKTKRKLVVHFRARSAIPEVFQNRDIFNPELNKILSLAGFSFSSNLTSDGYRVLYLQSPQEDFEMQDTILWAKMIFMSLDYYLHIDIYYPLVIILDASIAQLKNLPKIPIVLLKKLFFVLFEGYPVRIKQIHIINANPLVGILIKWASKIIKEKIIRRIQVHNELESLYQFVPKEFLPKDLGGYADSVENCSKEVVKNLEEDVDWFNKFGELKADETKRIDYGYSLFGVEGSFRQLQID